ncbi:MAG: hypothetical protein HQ559_13930, partial [Lentisphaerae bacterium]|nr:hypothetical protein [Lentisphaerota bacterium]
MKGRQATCTLTLSLIMLVAGRVAVSAQKAEIRVFPRKDKAAWLADMPRSRLELRCVRETRTTVAGDVEQRYPGGLLFGRYDSGSGNTIKKRGIVTIDLPDRFDFVVDALVVRFGDVLESIDMRLEARDEEGAFVLLAEQKYDSLYYDRLAFVFDPRTVKQFRLQLNSPGKIPIYGIGVFDAALPELAPPENPAGKVDLMSGSEKGSVVAVDRWDRKGRVERLLLRTSAVTGEYRNKLLPFTDGVVAKPAECPVSGDTEEHLLFDFVGSVPATVGVVGYAG